MNASDGADGTSAELRSNSGQRLVPRFPSKRDASYTPG